MELEYKTLPFEIKSVADAGEFEGYGATFGNVDRGGDICVAGCFADSLAEFKASGVIAWQHDWTEPIGKPGAGTREDAKGLYVTGKLSDTAKGRDARTLMKDGVVTQMSIGYEVTKATKITPENIKSYVDPASVDPKLLARAFDYGRALEAVKLYEVSPVSVAMNPAATISRVKSLVLDSKTLEDHLDLLLYGGEDLLTRLADLKSRGRDLSPERKAKLDSICSLFEKMVEATQAAPEMASADQVRALDVKWLETQARVRGIYR
jgi:HK97 family phage prohead protease